MNKFITITDMRETVGMEEQVGRLTILNVDHIVSIEAVEDHVAELLNYRSVIKVASGGTFFPTESQEEIVEKIFE